MTISSGLWKLLPLLLKRRLFRPSLILLQWVGAKRRKIGQISGNKLASHLYMCHSTLGAVAIWVHCPQLLTHSVRSALASRFCPSDIKILHRPKLFDWWPNNTLRAFASLGFCCSFDCLSTVQLLFLVQFINNTCTTVLWMAAGLLSWEHAIELHTFNLAHWREIFFGQTIHH